MEFFGLSILIPNSFPPGVYYTFCGFFLGVSAISHKSAKAIQSPQSRAKNWQQMSTNPASSGYICCDGISPLQITRLEPMPLLPGPRRRLAPTPRQNVYACARLSISGLFFSHTFQSDQSLPRALGFILCAACGSVVLTVFSFMLLVFLTILWLLKLLLWITRHRSLKQLVD